MSISRNILAGLALAIAGAQGFAVENPKSPDADSTRSKSARELYNAGTEKLHDGKLAEAQDLLRAAAAANDADVMPSAVFNLGHARYEQGARELKQILDHSQAGRHAAFSAQSALESARAALANGNMDALIEAYRRGNGARKELRAAGKAIQAALAHFGNILINWQRASADFRSAGQLDPSDTNAVFNAGLVDRRIAALIDRIRMQQLALANGAKTGSELKDAMNQIKNRLPKGFLDSPEDSDEGDEPEDEEGFGPRTFHGTQPEPISPEQAQQLLRSIQLDSQRTLPVSNARGPRPAKRNGGDW